MTALRYMPRLGTDAGTAAEEMDRPARCRSVLEKSNSCGVGEVPARADAEACRAKPGATGAVTEELMGRLGRQTANRVKEAAHTSP